MKQADIIDLNQQLNKRTPQEIIEWAIAYSKKPVVTTNFRPYEAAILHGVSSVKSDIPVVWCDTGYNTTATYQHAEELIKSLGLNIKLFVPKQTTAHRNVTMGIPSVDHENHSLFSEQVKLEPFRRALSNLDPDLWFTNLRKGQTAFRDSIDIVSLDKSGRIKVSPFYNHSDSDLDEYLKKHNLPNEHKYYDPTKALENRECGIHN